MKVTFTFDSDEQRQQALRFMPELPDSNEVEIPSTTRFPQIFMILRRFLPNTSRELATQARSKALEAAKLAKVGK